MAKAKQIQARALTDFHFGGQDIKANVLIEGDEGDIKVLVNAGQADQSDAAVAYARELAAGVAPVNVSQPAAADEGAVIE